GQPPAGRLRRRADRQPGPADIRRPARIPAPRGLRLRPDGGDGHPRPSRRGGRRPGGVPRRRHRTGRARRTHPGPRPGRDQGTGGVSRMLRVTVASLLAHRLRLILTAAAIALGVALVAGTFILTDSVQGALAGSGAAGPAGYVIVQPA